MPSFWVINRFLEDTCVITALAYLISRGALLPRLFDNRQRNRDLILLAIVFGLAGGSELVFPGDRYPYITFTLMASFAGYAGGPKLGGLTIIVMIALVILGTLLGKAHLSFGLYILSISSACLIGACAALLRTKLEQAQHDSGKSIGIFLLGACMSGAISEGTHCALLHWFVTDLRSSWVLVAYSVCSNGFASLLLGLVLWDAHMRHEANERQVQTERELASMRLSQLEELQARLHPHFLFNALAGLAGLCVADPTKAERGIADLANLLRRFMRAPSEVSVSLQEELETIHTYLAIEKLRLGDRLQVRECIPNDLVYARVPRFALQVPVENAVQHGAAMSQKACTVTIVAKRRGNTLILAVCDDGPGAIKELPVHLRTRIEREDRPHGLTLLAARLQLAHGASARLRLFSAPGHGTICILRIPVGEPS